MSRKGLEQARTYREVHAHFERHPALVGRRNNGHVVYVGPRGAVPVPGHNGDCPRGTLRNIVKMATLAGLAMVVVCVVLTVFV